MEMGLKISWREIWVQVAALFLDLEGAAVLFPKEGVCEAFGFECIVCIRVFFWCSGVWGGGGC